MSVLKNRSAYIDAPPFESETNMPDLQCPSRNGSNKGTGEREPTENATALQYTGDTINLSNCDTDLVTQTANRLA